MIRNLLILDTETTGKDADAQILSFHASRIAIKERNKTNSPRELAFPLHAWDPPLPLYIVPDADRPISPGAFLVHGLTTKKILEKEGVMTSFEAAVRLRRWISALHRHNPIAIAAWNARFDFRAMDTLLRRNLLEPLFVDRGMMDAPAQVDLMPMYSAMQLFHPDQFPFIYNKEKGYVSRKLEDAVHSAGISADDAVAHDVVDDVDQFAAPIFDQMLQVNTNLVLHMLSCGEKTHVRGMLRQPTQKPLYHINTSGQVAYGEWLMPVPLPEARDKQNKPWHEKKLVVALNIGADNLKALPASTAETLAALLKPPRLADGSRALTRTYRPEDVATLQKQPLRVLDLREPHVLFDKGAARYVTNIHLGGPEKAKAELALSLAQDAMFQDTLYAAMNLAFPDNPAFPRPTPEAIEKNKQAKDLRFDFHNTQNWEERAAIMRSMEGDDRINALRIITQHAPNILTRGDQREWGTYLAETLLTEHGTKVTLASVERECGEIMASEETSAADKQKLRGFMATEIPRIKQALLQAAPWQALPPIAHAASLPPTPEPITKEPAIMTQAPPALENRPEQPTATSSMVVDTVTRAVPERPVPVSGEPRYLLRLAFSASTLLDMREAHKIFSEQGEAAYVRHMRDNENKSCGPGVLYPLARLLLHINKLSGKRLFDLVLVSQNHGDAAIRIEKSLMSLGFTDKGWFSFRHKVYNRGHDEDTLADLARLKVDTYFGSNAELITKALQRGIAAAHFVPSAPSVREMATVKNILRTKNLQSLFDLSRKTFQLFVDFDGVLADWQSENNYQRIFRGAKKRIQERIQEGKISGPYHDQMAIDHAVPVYDKKEGQLEDTPMAAGPLAPFIVGLSHFVDIRLLTARGGHATHRALKTLRGWGCNNISAIGLQTYQSIDITKAEVMGVIGGENPSRIPLLFVDDSIGHINAARASGISATGHVRRNPKQHTWLCHANALERVIVFGKILGEQGFSSSRAFVADAIPPFQQLPEPA